MSKYQESIERGKIQWGEKFDPSELEECNPTLQHYFNGPRVKITTTYKDGETYTRTGRIGRTTGWRPAFLLMHRSSDSGSSDVQIGRAHV